LFAFEREKVFVDSVLKFQTAVRKACSLYNWREKWSWQIWKTGTI